jgi:hypothetical protein
MRLNLVLRASFRVYTPIYYIVIAITQLHYMTIAVKVVYSTDSCKFEEALNLALRSLEGKRTIRISYSIYPVQDPHGVIRHFYNAFIEYELTSDLSND